MAQIIGKSELLWNDWAVVLDAYRTMEKTTEADLKRLAEKYLNSRNRTSIFLTRPPMTTQAVVGDVVPRNKSEM